MLSDVAVHFILDNPVMCFILYRRKYILRGGIRGVVTSARSIGWSVCQSIGPSVRVLGFL